ncbi:MAG TPA: DUF1810 domain-containing protein [Puia sp.]|jgi:uncharacterized protein (DUF1810 family)
MDYDLDRFLIAQATHYGQALKEIRAGQKKSHWIWYIFPQLQGLGFSHNASYYGIKDLQEAVAYLRHPILGPRLVEISKALLLHKDKSPIQLMGSPDDMKLCSCMTLFSLVPDADPVFSEVLDVFFEGRRDAKTDAKTDGGGFAGGSGDI